MQYTLAVNIGLSYESIRLNLDINFFLLIFVNFENITQRDYRNIDTSIIYKRHVYCSQNCPTPSPAFLLCRGIKGKNERGPIKK